MSLLGLSAAVLGSVAALVGGAELLARAVLKRRDRWYVHRPYAHRKRHIATDVLPELDAVASFKANRDGERGGPVPPLSTERWLVAGGSAAECFYLDQGAIWSSVLERELGQLRSGAPVHVGNVARSLIPSRTIAALLARSLKHFDGLDGILLMVGASDLVRWLEDGAPEHLQDPVPIEDIDVARFAEENPTGTFGWKTPKRLALYRVARRVSARILKRADVRTNVGASLAGHRTRRASAKTMVDSIGDERGLLDAYRRDLATLIEVCRRFAPRVILVRQPWLDRDFSDEEAKQLWNFGQGSPYRGDVDTYYSTSLVADLMSAIDSVTAQAAAANDIEAIDLRATVPSDFDHYYDFLHFSPKGADVVGRAIARYLSSEASGELQDSADQQKLRLHA